MRVEGDVGWECLLGSLSQDFDALFGEQATELEEEERDEHESDSD